MQASRHSRTQNSEYQQRVVKYKHPLHPVNLFMAASSASRSPASIPDKPGDAVPKTAALHSNLFVVLHADFAHEFQDVALAELLADADEGVLFADVEDAEEGFDQFGVARKDVFHEFFAGFGEADDGDAAAAAGYVL
jgi:hypothetical protein